jgi:hypothetical protein
MELVSTALALAGPLTRVAKSLLGSSTDAQRGATANALGVIAQEARGIAQALSNDIGANVNEMSAALEARAERLPEILEKFTPKDDVTVISVKIISITTRLNKSYDLPGTKGPKERRYLIRDLEWIAGRFGAQAQMLREATPQSSDLLKKMSPAWVKVAGVAASTWSVAAAIATTPLSEITENLSENYGNALDTVGKALRLRKGTQETAADDPDTE